ncbi:glycoside hydrolase family 16 protein [Cryptosporangium aurantiacum]|uniref:Beta-glucanase, GH16 family n=1 Tax=Cryptosporangium aurantiacum TaxID=134849 RepID=A0A1M7RL81_9ACTN|nr:glycoside hydrolase family 16 protein [Cryptosporangium aurantiacum]SHN47063.1 Beta-glucanase, GH16 family [Cryptosporangium aurantiacum]
MGGRVIVAALAVLAALVVTPVTPAAAADLVLDVLTVPATAEEGQALSATARLRTTGGPVAVEALTVAVRDSDGGHFDFPGAHATTVPAEGYTFTTGHRTFPAGDYEIQVAVQLAGRWLDLRPHRYLTVRTNPVTFRQEFSGPAGAGPNYGLSTAMWFADPCREGCTGSLTRYSPDQARLDGRGHLALVAERVADTDTRCGGHSCRYAGPRLTMLDWVGNDGVAAWSQQGGHVSVRLKAPAGRGLRPALRTVGADQASAGLATAGGIDVVEAPGHRPGFVRQRVAGSLGFSRTVPLPGDGRSTDWHVYAVDWRSGPDGYLKWSVDGVRTAELTAAQAGAAWAAFRRPHALVLELAVDDAPTEPDAATTFPATALVDWLRVQRYPIQ